MIGDALFPIALAFAVLDGLDGSPGELGLVLAAQVVPMTFLVLAAGVWADRMSRRRLMLVSDLGRAAVQAVLAALLLAARRRALAPDRALRRSTARSRPSSARRPAASPRRSCRRTSSSRRTRWSASPRTPATSSARRSPAR